MKKLFLLVALPFMATATINAQTTPAYLKKETTHLEKEIRQDKGRVKKMEVVTNKERKALKKLEGNEVSYQSKQAFARDFNNITPTYEERLANYDEFIFSKNGKTLSAFYDANSKLVGTIQDETFEDLPSKAREEISKDYKDYTPGDVIFFDDNELNRSTDMILYGFQFEPKDSYFVEMKKPSQKIVLQVLKDGNVIFFTQLT